MQNNIRMSKCSRREVKSLTKLDGITTELFHVED